MSKAPVVGILLAAGQGRRFGSNKLLYPVLQNTPMLMVSAGKLASALSASIAVINPGMRAYATQLEQLGMQVVVNEHADRGMGSSIACGVEASANADGWLIALADMPFIETDTIRQLAGRLEGGAAIVAPLFEDQRGHPVGFSCRYRDELMSLNGDSGARSVIAHHGDGLECMPTTDKGVITDIDHVSSLSAQQSSYPVN